MSGAPTNFSKRTLCSSRFHIWESSALRAALYNSLRSRYLHLNIVQILRGLFYIFTSFSPTIFLTNKRKEILEKCHRRRHFGDISSLVSSKPNKCPQLKSPKTTTFSRIFHPKNPQFAWEIKVEFLDKKWRFRTVCIPMSCTMLYQNVPR